MDLSLTFSFNKQLFPNVVLVKSVDVALQICSWIYFLKWKFLGCGLSTESEKRTEKVERLLLRKNGHLLMIFFYLTFFLMPIFPDFVNAQDEKVIKENGIIDLHHEDNVPESLIYIR